NIVSGQDSAHIVALNGTPYFFFGDTKRCGLPYSIPNSAATTTDTNASDGIAPLTYYASSGVFAQPVLSTRSDFFSEFNTDPREDTVWLSGSFVLGNDIYSYYTA